MPKPALLEESFRQEERQETHENSLRDYTEIPKPALSEKSFRQEEWQETYESLLRDYMELSDDLFFLLYDLDKDGTPELIVAGEYMDELYDAVYTYRDSEVLPLEYSEKIFTAHSVLYARGGLTSAPDNGLGLIDYFVGPSAGAFGTSAWYMRIVIDGNRLVIDTHGERNVDVAALSELFDESEGDLGRGINVDSDMLVAAIIEHTYYYINSVAVTSDDFYRMFEAGEPLLPLKISEANIRDIILVVAMRLAYQRTNQRKIRHRFAHGVFYKMERITSPIRNLMWKKMIQPG